MQSPRQNKITEVNTKKLILIQQKTRQLLTAKAIFAGWTSSGEKLTKSFILIYLVSFYPSNDQKTLMEILQLFHVWFGTLNQI